MKKSWSIVIIVIAVILLILIWLPSSFWKNITGDVVITGYGIGAETGQSANKSNIIPGIIQAENFDNGGEGVAYHDTYLSNEGDSNYRSDEGVDLFSGGTALPGAILIGGIKTGEWLEYTINVTQAGIYNISFSVASSGNGGKFHILVNGINKTNLSGGVDYMNVPNTNGWFSFRLINMTNVSLAKGIQLISIYMDTNGASGYVGNLDYMNFSLSQATGSTGPLSCAEKCVVVGTGVNTPYFSGGTLDCIYGSTCNHGIYPNNSGNVVLDFWITYYYSNGDKKEICGCNGTTIVDGKTVLVSTTNEHYTYSFLLSDSPHNRRLTAVEIKTAVNIGSSRSGFISASKDVRYNNCDYSCGYLGEQTGVPGFPNKYKNCTLSGNCFNWSGEFICSQKDQVFDSNSKKCISTGIAFSCEDAAGSTYNKTFCNYQGISTANAVANSKSCSIQQYSCYNCIAGFYFNTNALRCINLTCANTCNSNSGICSDNSIDNSQSSSSYTCCGLGTCYVCNSGFHKYNSNCVNNNCSGNSPVNIIGIIIGPSVTTSGDGIWKFDYNANSSTACLWKCNSSYHINRSDNVSCIVGKPDCESEIDGGHCSAAVLSNADATEIAEASCSNAGEKCYACKNKRTWNGSTCLRCPPGQAPDANDNCQVTPPTFSCSAGKCLFVDANAKNRCLRQEYRIENDSGKYYCSNGILLLQKALNISCNKDSECLSNVCGAGICVDIFAQEQAQTGMLSKIICYFKKFFNIADPSCSSII
jgi:hypothetical protein